MTVMRLSLDRLTRHRSGMVAGGFVFLLVVIGLFVNFIPGIDPHAISNDVLEAASSGFLLGTDELGRSVLAGILYGTQISVAVGFFAAIVATVLGVLIGSVAGFFGGWLDTAVMRIAEFFQVIPSFILAAVIVALAG